jgi:superfamily I DNA/RNA helicase/RecB family exonuclease
VLCLALESAAARGLERRLVGRGDAPEALPQVLTYEQVARQILTEAHGDPAGRFLDPLAERLLVSRALEATAGQARRFRKPALRESPRFRDDVADFIAELKRHQLTPEAFREQVVPGLRGGTAPADESERAALQDLADVYERYQQSLQEAGLFDLRGLLWLALMALEEPARAEAWRRRFSLVLADDLQDATPLHLELLAALVGAETELAATYEPSEAIYRFRGAVGDPSGGLARLLPERRVEQVAAPLGGPPPRVAEVAERFAERYGLAPTGGSRAPELPSSRAGEVRYALYRSREEELEGLGEALGEELARGRQAEEMAVITRSAAERRGAAEYLARRGLPVGEPEGAPGAGQARRVLTDLLTVRQAAADGARGVRPGRTARQQANAALGRLADLIAAPEEQLRLPELARRPQDLGRGPLPENCPALAALREEVRAGGEGSAAELGRLARWLLARAPAAERERLHGPLAALAGQVSRGAEQMRRLTGREPQAEEIRAALAEARVPAVFPAPAIAVLTAHQTRGRHFPLVFLLGLQEETFPAPVVISRLLAPETAAQLREKVRRVLNLPEGVLSFAGLGEAPAEAEQEEERLFYVCLTRSSERLVLSAHLEEAGAPLTPSPYLAAALPGDFRLQPGAAVDRDFTCAFAGLAPESGEGRAGHAGCPVRPCARGEGRARRAATPVEEAQEAAGLVPVLREAAAGLTLWASGLQEYLRCPRRFFLGRLLKVGAEEEADERVYGDVIHACLSALNHRDPVARTEQEARVHLAAALEKHGGRFSSPLAADLYAQTAEAAIGLYLTTQTAGATTRFPEQGMVLTLRDGAGGQHRFGGRIDVAEVTEGGVAVVDYKTGAIASAKKLRERIPPLAEEAAGQDVELQLPLYALLWAGQAAAAAAPVRRICLQRIHPDPKECRRQCVELADQAQERPTLTPADLEKFRALLVAWAAEIKGQTKFGGRAPEEGCGPRRGCPFAGICDAAELT